MTYSQEIGKTEESESEEPEGAGRYKNRMMIKESLLIKREFGRFPLVYARKERACLLFVIGCMLYNPMSVNWNEEAHYSLARNLNGKDGFMLEKSFNQGVYEVDLMIASSD